MPVAAADIYHALRLAFGVGWAYEIPKVDRFFVAMDVDVYFRDTFEGDTIDPRSGRDYYVYN